MVLGKDEGKFIAVSVIVLAVLIGKFFIRISNR
jgi:hypothetical protein